MRDTPEHLWFADGEHLYHKSVAQFFNAWSLSFRFCYLLLPFLSLSMATTRRQTSQES